MIGNLLRRELRQSPGRQDGDNTIVREPTNPISDPIAWTNEE
jgi:hypothetical protein